MRGLVLVVLFWCSAAAVAAADDRMERLRNGQALEWIEATGHWDVTFSDRQMVMICKTCEGMVEVVLDVVPLPLETRRAEWTGRFLAERMLFCSKLVQEGGRCLGTRDARYRGEALQGFRSSHLDKDIRTTEIVFFNWDMFHGPEVLRASIATKDGQGPQGTMDLMLSAMAQLTHYW